MTKNVDNHKFLYIFKNDMFVITICFKPLSYMWDYSSAGEHLVDIEGVTSSILVSPTISTIFQNDNNYNDLACKTLKLLGYLNCLVRRWTDFTPTIIYKLCQKYPFYRLKSSEIVCKSLSIFWKIIPTQNRVQRVRPKNSLEKIIFKFNNM